MQKFKKGVSQSWPSFITVMPDDPKDSYHHVYFKNGLDNNGYPLYEFISESSYFTTGSRAGNHHSRESTSFTLVGDLITICFCVEGKDSSWRFCRGNNVTVSKPGKNQKSPLGFWGNGEFVVEGNGLLMVGRGAPQSINAKNTLCFAL